MRNFLLSSMLLFPSVFMAQELPVLEDKGRAVSILCQSRGSGFASSLTIALAAGGFDLYQGVLSSVGLQTHIFPVYLEGEVKSEEKFTINFNNEFASPEQAIKGTLSIDLKEAELDGETVFIPAGSGQIDLTLKPQIGPTVFSKYILERCEGIIR